VLLALSLEPAIHLFLEQAPLPALPTQFGGVQLGVI
jgi:hypothetical protein